MSDNGLIKAVGQMAGTHNKTYGEAIVCSVSSVDLSTRSCICTPLGGRTTSDLTEVQLMAEVEDGWLIEPVIGSTVIVNSAQRSRPYIALFSEIQNAYLVVAGSIQFQGGEFGGLVKVIELTDKLNNLENGFNDLVGKFNAHTHILALTAGTGSAAPTTDPETTILAPTEREDIENTIITHGA